MTNIRLPLQPERQHDGGADTDIRHPVRLFTRLFPIQIERDFLAAKFRARPSQQITQCLRCKPRIRRHLVRRHGQCLYFSDTGKKAVARTIAAFFPAAARTRTARPVSAAPATAAAFVYRPRTPVLAVAVIYRHLLGMLPRAAAPMTPLPPRSLAGAA